MIFRRDVFFEYVNHEHIFSCDVVVLFVKYCCLVDAPEALQFSV